MKKLIFIITLFLSVAAGAALRWPPEWDGGVCPTDKPLGQWEYCLENELNCVAEGAGKWKWICYACDSQEEVILRINGNQKQCQLCPNRYLNAEGNCVLDSAYSHWQDFLYIYIKPYWRSLGYLSAIFIFPFIFMLAKIFPKKKKWAFLCWCAFIALCGLTYLIPLLVGTWLMLPYSLWVAGRDMGRFIHGAVHHKDTTHGLNLCILAVLFVILGVIDMALFIPVFLITISLYTTFSINKQLKQKGEK